MHEWMVDNNLTPHLVVDANREGVDVPPGQARDGKIVLNVSLSATLGLVLGNESIAFQARFAGVSRSVTVPVGAVLGIYARETGQGMIFGEEGQPPPGAPPPAGGPSPVPPPAAGKGAGAPKGERKPRLKVVK